ncbi:hypothetical protein D3C75_665650 [compost metagenome]
MGFHGFPAIAFKGGAYCLAFIGTVAYKHRIFRSSSSCSRPGQSRGLHKKDRSSYQPDGFNMDRLCCCIPFRPDRG